MWARVQWRRRKEGMENFNPRIQQSRVSAVFICTKLVMTFQVSLRLKCLLDHFELSCQFHVTLLTSRGRLLKEQRHLIGAQRSLIACLGPSNRSCSASSSNTKGKARGAGEGRVIIIILVFFSSGPCYAPCHCVNVPATRETHNAPLSPVY